MVKPPSFLLASPILLFSLPILLANATTMFCESNDPLPLRSLSISFQCRLEWIQTNSNYDTSLLPKFSFSSFTGNFHCLFRTSTIRTSTHLLAGHIKSISRVPKVSSSTSDYPDYYITSFLYSYLSFSPFSYPPEWIVPVSHLSAFTCKATA